jgi:hypothetical protein
MKTIEKPIMLSTPVWEVIVSDAITNICTIKHGIPVYKITLSITENEGGV